MKILLLERVYCPQLSRKIIENKEFWHRQDVDIKGDGTAQKYALKGFQHSVMRLNSESFGQSRLACHSQKLGSFKRGGFGPKVSPRSRVANSDKLSKQQLQIKEKSPSVHSVEGTRDYRLVSFASPPYTNSRHRKEHHL